MSSARTEVDRSSGDKEAAFWSAQEDGPKKTSYGVATAQQEAARQKDIEFRQKFGDAGPLGLSGFAFATFLTALVNLNVHGVTIPNIVIGPALAYGGLAQLLSGMWDIANGNTVSATIACSYGCFWISFAISMIPSFNVRDAYPSLADYNHANGLFLMGFFIFSVAITLCSMKSNVFSLTLCLLVNCTWLFLGVANLWTEESGAPNNVLLKCGGVTGLLVSFTAWYLMYEGLANRQNRAAYLLSPNSPLIEVKPAPVPQPRPNELLVRAEAVAINPVDAVKQSMGNMMFEWLTYPLILGYDVTGQVVKAGADVTQFKEGDRIVGLAAGMDKRGRRPDEGAFQELVVIREHLAIKVPAGMKSADSSVLPLTAVTAACALFQKDQLALRRPQIKAHRKPTGETVLVWGASTSVGKNAVQLAVAAGYDVVATSSPKNWDSVRSLGASAVFDYRSSSVIDDIVTSLKDKKCAGAVAIGQGSLGKCVDIIKMVPGAAKKVAQVTIDMPASPLTSKLSMVPFVAKYVWLSSTNRLKVISSGLRSKFVFGTDIMEWDVEGKIALYLSEALELGEYDLPSEACVIGTGLEKISEGLDKVRSETSGKKIVVVLK
ncbi:oxidoreductase [Fusarium bulbicola]|nr:oxidoreductase [Fusarium bulbicola]